MKKEVTARRLQMLYHFSKVGKHNTKHSKMDDAEDGGRVTRSSVAEEEDWIIDMAAANCEVTDTRKLSRYPIEHIWTLDEGTPLLLLVEVSDDAKLFNGKGAVADASQNCHGDSYREGNTIN